MSTLPVGVTASVSPPVTYTMAYLNGPITYRESFAVLTYGSAWIQGAEGIINFAVGKLVDALAASAPEVAAALTVITGIGEKWFNSCVLNSDGSLTVQFAYHYCGTPGGGIDVTAFPLPGVNAQWYQNAVNNLSTQIRPHVNPDSQVSESTSSHPVLVSTHGRTPQGSAAGPAH